MKKTGQIPLKMGITLYKHKNMTDVAVEVIRIIKIPDKDYYKIKVRWWRLGPKPYCMEYKQWLTDASICGNKKQKMKYPRSKWRAEWEQIRI